MSNYNIEKREEFIKKTKELIEREFQEFNPPDTDFISINPDVQKEVLQHISDARDSLEKSLALLVNKLSPEERISSNSLRRTTLKDYLHQLTTFKDNLYPLTIFIFNKERGEYLSKKVLQSKGFNYDGE